jgi:DMSO reductase family type II enzyme heme b subunit
MFPLQTGASAITMGSADKPVNAWFWKADEALPCDVYAEGYATSERRKANQSGLTATGYYDNERWTVVFQRDMKVAEKNYITFAPASDTTIAFAVWEGSNKERSGQKSVSGEFTGLSVAG